MTFQVVHRLPGRLRVRCGRYHFSEKQAQAAESYLLKRHGILEAKVSSRTGSILLLYTEIDEIKALQMLRSLQVDLLDTDNLQVKTSRNNEEFVIALGKKFLVRYIVKPFLPLPIRHGITFIRSMGYFRKGAGSIFTNKKIGVEVLDAAAIACSLVQNDFETAGSIMFLLNISEMIEEWTKKKSKENLADTLQLNVDKVWLCQDGQDVLIPFSKLQLHDHIRIQSGAIIPVDGTVVSGEAMVNQSTLTGEPLSVKRSAGNTVFAGTTIEEGGVVVEVTALTNETRINNIIQLINHSEQYKSLTQSRRESFADAIVPFSFLGAFLTYGLTGSFAKAASILLVDYSCAIKLSSSLSVLGALEESGKQGIFAKGGKFLEEYATADTIVFDKTGTLTVACPKVKKILSFDNYTEEEILKIAACLEEHFPHSVARAVVSKAENQGILHPEVHAKVEYIVAHGIVSAYDNKRVIIGSEHFIFEDEQIPIEQDKYDAIFQNHTSESVLFLAIDGKLEGAIFIEDPLRESAKNIVSGLQNVGFKNIYMLTGDSKKATSQIAGSLGITNYQAQMLPEEKAHYITKLRADGRKVVMIGDGINDTPALSAANVGISMKDGADIAKEVADISLMAEDLEKLIVLRQIATGLLEKNKKQFRFIMAFNSALLAFGLLNILTPAQSAMFHNASTVGIGINSLRPVLKSTQKSLS